MRFLFILLEFAFGFLALYLLIAQVLMPAFRGTALFPIFRKEQKIRDELIDLNQQKQEEELYDELEARRREWYGTSTKEETDAAQAAAIAKQRERKLNARQSNDI